MPQGIQYPTGYQPFTYEPPAVPQYPSGYQPFPEATPIGTAMAGRTGIYTPDWMQDYGSVTSPTTTTSALRAGYYIPDWMKKIGPAIYSGAIEPLENLFGEIQSTAKKAAYGDFTDAANLATTTWANPLKQTADLGARIFTGQFPLPGATWESSEEEKRKAGISEAAGMAGLPAEKVLKAYEEGDYATLGGMGVGAAGFNALLHYLGKGKPAAREITGELPPPPGGAAPPPPPSAGIMDPRQPRLPGMENVDFSSQIPEARMPTREVADPRAQGMAAIDAQTQQQIFELTLQRTEAQRMGDLTRVTQIDNAILEAKMRANDLKQNWQPTPEPAAPTFPEMPTEQGDLRGFTWRQDNKFTNPANIAPEMRQGVLRPTPFEFPPVESMAPVRPEGTPFEQHMRAQTQPQELSLTMPETAGPEPALPPVIDMPTDRVELQLRKNQGYVTHPTLRGPEGQLQMVRGELAQMLPPTPAAPTLVTPPAVGARVGPGGTSMRTVGGNADITVPTARAEAPGFIENMQEGGYEVYTKSGDNTIFRHRSNLVGTRIGSMDIEQAIRIVRAGLQRVANSPAGTKARTYLDELLSRARSGVREIPEEEVQAILRGFNQEEVQQPISGRMGPSIDPTVMRQEPLPSVAMEPPLDIPQNRAERLQLKEADIEEINSSHDVATARQIVDFWEDNLPSFRESADTEAYNHALDMLARANARLTELRAGRRNQLSPEERLIREAQTAEELNALVDHFGDVISLDANRGNPADMQRAQELNHLINIRRAELGPSPQPGSPGAIVNRLRTAEENIRNAATREQVQAAQRDMDELWRESSSARDNDTRTEAHRIRMSGYERLRQLREGESRPAQTQTASQPTISEMTISELGRAASRATRLSDLTEIRSRLLTEFQDALDSGDYASQSHIEGILQNIERKMGGGEVQEPLNLQNKTAAESIPIVEGPQPPYKGPIQMGEEPYDRLARASYHTRQARAQMSPEQLKREKISLAQWDPTWDGWARRELHHIPNGTPGLEIVKEGYHSPTPTDYYGRYRVTYRGPDGKPVVTAIITQGADGTRKVGTLAADRFKDTYDPTTGHVTGRVNRGGLLGRAVYQVGMKLVELDAAEASGTISQHTANLIESISDKVRAGIDVNSAELANLIARLMKMKQYEGQPVRIRTPEDLAELIANMGSDAGPQPELPFEPRAARQPRTAAELETLPEQPNLDFAGGEQMPLPLESAVNRGPFDSNEYGPTSGETRGRVAKFATPTAPKNLFEATKELQRIIKGGISDNEPNMRALDAHVQKLIEAQKTESEARLASNEMKAASERVADPDEAEMLHAWAMDSLDKARRLKVEENERFGFGQIRSRKDIQKHFTPDTAPKIDPESGAIDPRMFDPREWIKLEGIRNTITNFFKRGPNKEPSTFEEILGLPTAATTIADVSMPLRQGLPTIFTPEWRSALKTMFTHGFTAERAKMVDDQIRSMDIYQKRFDETTGKWQKSFAEEAGIPLIEGTSVSASENAIASGWIETGGNLGKFSEKYRQTWGKVAKVSNRAAATFLNHLRANTAKRMFDASQKMAIEAETTGSARPGLRKQSFTPQEAAELNAYNNLPLAKAIGDFINTATGRAPLKLDIVPIPGAPALNLEKAASGLRYLLFSPRNMFSRMRMLSPATYVMAPPQVRKAYMKSALATASAWYMMTQLTKVATQALGYDATVSDDEESADFGKMRIGNTRLDLGGGFQQFYVAANRMWSGMYRSSASQQRHAYGQGFRPETQRSAMQRFMVNKLNPMTKFGYDLWDASQYNPFHVYDRTAQLFIPLAIQDTIEILKEDPNLLPVMMPPVLLGGGSQIYEKGESIAKIVPKEYDWVVTGGGLRDVVDPRNWQLFGGK